MNKKSPFGNYTVIDNEIYVEITDKEVQNVSRGQFINRFGDIYDYITENFRYPRYNEKGYQNVLIRLENGKYKTTGLHRILMLVYMYEDGCENLVVNHLNGIKDDNRLSNFEWTTPKGNLRHAYRTGLRNNCLAPGNSPIVEETAAQIVQELIARKDEYGLIAKLARKYNTSESAIRNLANGDSWADISSQYNLDYSVQYVNSLLTEDQVRYICEEASKGRDHGFCTRMGKMFNVCPSTIKEIIQRRSWTEISKDYDFPSKINNKLSDEQIHQICQIIQNHGYYDMNVYNEILDKLNLESSSQLMHNIKRLHRHDPHCYYDITSQYNWEYVKYKK